MKSFEIKQLLVCLLTGLLCVSHSNAEITEIQKARKEAAAFFSGHLKSTHQENLQLVYNSPTGVTTPVYAFQRASKGHAVVVKSGDEFVIVGYSESGNLDSENLPDGFIALLHLFENMDEPIAKPDYSLKGGTTGVAPLLASRGVNLNQTYHTDAGGCPSGCAATAMTQIIAYHRHPQQGTGSHCYQHPTQGEKCADFTEFPFDWDNINLTNLQHYVGIGMEMNFCGSAFGSFPMRTDFYNVPEDYFGFYVHTQGLGREYLLNELNHGRPFYATIMGEWANHAVVVDGYDSNGFLHIHFGWGGLGNGFYQINGVHKIEAGGNRYNSGFLVNAFVSPTPYTTNKQDSLALIALHNSLNGQTGWDITTPVVKWPGVFVINERVVQIQLGSFSSNISGSIPPEIGELTKLKRFILNADIEEIPVEFGNLTNLVFLRLNGNINGIIPNSITNLSNLEYIAIHKGVGDLSWHIPNDIHKMKNLQEVNLTNIVEGELPQSLGQLRQLKSLNLHNGKITGSLPSSIGELENLEILNLDGHQITGTIPSSIEELSNLRELNLSNNQLTGSIPVGLGQLSKLRTIRLANNQLSGSLPEQLNWPELISLQLSENHIEGNIPSSISSAKKLQGLFLNSNQFTELPKEIGALNAITQIDLSKNKLTTIPETILNIPGITRFIAANNQISTIPYNFGAWPGLTELDLSHNQLTIFPDEICFLPNLNTINLSYNQIKQLPPAIAMFAPKGLLRLEHNELSGQLPKSFLNAPASYIVISQNRFTFEDLPAPEKLRHGIGDQKTALLSTNQVKAVYGDTIFIDIRDLGNFHHPDNQYYWFTYPDQIRSRFLSEMGNPESDPILKLIVNEETLSKQFYCKILNDNVPVHDVTHMGTVNTIPALRLVNTDTISIVLYTEQELVEKAYPESYVTESTSLHNYVVYDNHVTLVAPMGMRGNVSWEGSLDGYTWHKVTNDMEQQNVKINVVDFNEKELILSAQSPAWFRSVITEKSCDPIYSDSIRIKPLGEILFDDMVNVAEESFTVSVDSISVTLPIGLTSEDFRLTITKLENPPPADEIYRLSSVYDVTVSFGTVFDIPLEIKLKNIDLSEIDAMDIPNFRPVFYDDQTQRWVEYREGGISLEDDAIVFYTPHLTKLGWYEVQHGSYTHRFTKNRAEVIYKWGTGTGEDNSYLGYEYYLRNYDPKPWHNTNTDPDNGGTPYMIQDVAEYLNQVIDAFDEKGLNLTRSRFLVYVSNTGGGAYGHISAAGYARGYFVLNSQLLIETDDLRRTIAHEYMHYMQQFYMFVMTANTFWAEANAPLAGRLVWNEAEMSSAEPEVNLLQSYRPVEGDKSIFDLLGESWDAATFLPVLEKFTANTADANLSSTFLHYMHQLRDGTKLDPVKMMTDLHTLGGRASITWRNYLNDQIVAQMQSTIGQEYDDYVRYMLEGSNPKLTILNKSKGNPLSHVINNAKEGDMGTFARNMVYDFQNDENDPQVDDISFAVPYLASKMVMMNNNSKKRAVVVNYTRKHDLNPDGFVYYGRYDFESEQMILKEISDSTKYSMLLEPNSGLSADRYQNIGFLLFVNRRCPSVIGIMNNFNTSFELEAMPVINIYNLADARISDRSIHLYSDGQSRSFIIDGNINIPNTPKIKHTTTNYDSRKEMKSDSAYVVYASFIERIEVDNGANNPASITTWNKEQEITYNFVKGTIEIEQSIITTYRWGGYYLPQPNSDIYVPPYDHSIVNEVKRLKVKNVNSFTEGQYPGYYGNVLEFKTSNTTETLEALNNVYHSFTKTDYNSDGDVLSTSSAHYVSTDYSASDITVEIKLHDEKTFVNE
ncbi:leucine-rich repeat domain-containing protein [Natronoflexus pectinivorans]|uniref:Leucine-rich repeat (LRR) protein n=1 Tax=Natronoflexus pectinivorans TaxID=682526 RepID=A0A4R2GFB1_9BACT|nr:leucine-rich repeat domain-containing protein [Natronoflexus pectinivorans]TCO05989.1 Leucine-rich repeat (LRR) protein [Natronoflexus pectinivorans]